MKMVISEYIIIVSTPEARGVVIGNFVSSKIGKVKST